MDIEKLIERLEAWNEQHLSVVCGNGHFACDYLCENEDCIVVRAATALSTLQAENAQLRGELEYEREHANAYHEECGQWEAENEKLREKIEDARLKGYAKGLSEMSEENEKLQAELEQMKVERDAAVALVHEWEEYGRYLSPMGFTVPHNWRND